MAPETDIDNDRQIIWFCGSCDPEYKQQKLWWWPFISSDNENLLGKNVQSYKFINRSISFWWLAHRAHWLDRIKGLSGWCSGSSGEVLDSRFDGPELQSLRKLELLFLFFLKMFWDNFQNQHFINFFLNTCFLPAVSHPLISLQTRGLYYITLRMSFLLKSWKAIS